MTHPAMLIDQEKTDSLFAEVSAKVRSSVRQSRDAVLQASYRRLTGNPRDVDAIHVLAAFNLQNRNPRKSLAILHHDPTILDDNPVGHRLAAYAYLAQRETDSALQHFDQSVRLDPCQPDCWTMLGRIHEDSGQHDCAIAYYQRGIVFESTQHASALALSKLYARTKNLKDAIHTLRVSLLRDRGSPNLNLALAKLLQRRAAILGRKRNRLARQRLLTEACWCYQTANRSAPTSATYVSMGVLEQRLERFGEAKRSFERAVALNPGCPIAITHLANANVEAGNIDQALTQFESAISIDPQRAAAHFRSSRAKRFEAGPETDVYIAQLNGLLSNANLPNIDQVQLHFSIAKVLDDTGQYDSAWHHFDRANRLKRGHTQSVARRMRRRGSTSSAPVPLQEAADRTIHFFTKEFLASNRCLGNPSETPVFIVGMPRSGTTLTEQILSSHPDIAGAGELKRIDGIRRQIAGEVRAGTNEIYPDAVASLDRHQVREFADDYLTHLDTIRLRETRVTDKMPTNFIHLGLISLLFPRATVIHCRRNPMDVLVSCYCQNLNAPFCDLEQLVHYHRQYRRMMAHWHAVLPLEIHDVDYESLVTNPEANSRELINHCGLEWDDQCLQFHANSRAVHTPSKWQVRQRMYSSSIDKWRRFEPHLQQIAAQIQRDLAEENLPSTASAASIATWPKT